MRGMRIIRLNLCVNKLAQLDDQSYALMSAHSKEKVEMLRSGSDAHDMSLISWNIIL